SGSIIAFTTIVFGLFLYAADRWGRQSRCVEDMTIRHAFIIGMAQVIAIVPGTSRSGITMAAARMLGYDRENAARFSMVLSIPTIIAAGALTTVTLLSVEGATVPRDALAAAGLAFVAALLAIGGLMAWVRRASFTPFVIYRLVLGSVLLVALYA
ncbi:MAG TPA: undecaprenyl-diphosphate phosphatase, partial [Arenibaculum sp.]|nr:undecaprenyl-diphosphate phosphatase [Arenibaculum sp.]